MSDYQELKLPSADGYTLSLRVYDAAAPKAVVKIIHGMEEHQERYQDFAEFLQAAGYAVVTADLRGHGKSAPILSHIADKDGHLRLMEDEKAILDFIHGRWADVPVILFGHSMGTIIARAFLQNHSHDYAKVVLSGYPNPNGAAGAGNLLAGLLSVFKGAKGRSRLIDGMVLGPFAKAIPDAQSPLEWLSVNPDNVDAYAADPLCGSPFTLGSYQTLFCLIKMMASPKQYQDVRKDLPILLISGREDPCTGGDKGRADSESALRKAGFNELKIVTLDGMRHEILNETDRKSVYRIILDYING